MTTPTASRPRTGRRAPRRLDPDELAALEDERDFLLRSLDDLEREHDAGDLDDEDYTSLKDDYTARAAEVLRALDERREAFAAARRPRSRRRTLGVAAGILAIAVLAGVLVAQASGRRTEGQQATGEVLEADDPSARARECVPLIQRAPAEAITCLQSVLDEDPENPVALTYLGWTLLLSSQSLPQETAEQAVDSGERLLRRAVEADPRLPDPHAFLAVLYERAGRIQDAKAELDALDALEPPAAIRSLTDPLRERVERQLREGGGTSTTAPASTTTASPTGP